MNKEVMPMQTVCTFSERLKSIMKIRNVKAIDISNATGISKANISSYLSGRYEPKQKNIYLIAKFFAINEMWLVGYDCEMDKFSTNLDNLKKELYSEIDDMNESQLIKTKNFIKEYILK